MRLTALDPDWREGRRTPCAGISFLCPGCGRHSVTVWLRPPLDCGDAEEGETTYPWEWHRGGLGDVTVLAPIHLEPCGVWLLVEGELAEVG